MNGFGTFGDWIRYGATVLTVVTVPPAFLWWLIIHPLAGRLRRAGPTATFAVLIPLLVGIGVALYQVRGALVGTDLEWDPLLFSVGVVFYALSVRVELRVRRHLVLRILVGVPELSNEPGKLLTEGIYGQLRHPRYMAVLLGVLGLALMVNYSGAYVMFAVTIVAVVVTVALEDRELEQRFGDEYVRYRSAVPAILPKSLGFLREPTTGEPEGTGQ